MEDLRFVSSVVDGFFSNTQIRKRLKLIREKNISGWEKWAQVEFGIFLDEHDSVMQAGREGMFAIDGRKSDRTKAFVDFVFRKKNCTKDLLLGVEHKQVDSFTSCLSKMIEDANKLWGLKGRNLRQCYLLGIHNKENPENVVESVWERCGEILPSKKRIVSKPIGLTGYSYTIF